MLTACGASVDGPPPNPFDPDVHGPGDDACEVRLTSRFIGDFRYTREFNALGDMTVEISTRLDAPGYYRRTIAYGGRHVSGDSAADMNGAVYRSYSYRRDAQGGLTTTDGYLAGRSPERWKLTWHLDARGAPVQIDHDNDNDGVVEPEHVELLTQDAAGCIATIEYSTSTTRARDIRTSRPSDCALLQVDTDVGLDGTIDRSTTYTYDDAGRLTGTSDGLSYTYDDQGRVIGIASADTTETFTYDCGT
ncbi:MAG: hypothetical protein K8W52_04955 [Deltaproteobacteria bacterium]|nr:hypothetical protein [Deltaproteobacteria bacterium]